MIALLGRMLATLVGMADSVAAGVMIAVNIILAAVGIAIAAVFGLLPHMPSVPDPPDAIATASGYIAYFIPTATILAYVAALVAIWVSFLIYRVIMKWIRAL